MTDKTTRITEIPEGAPGYKFKLHDDGIIRVWETTKVDVIYGSLAGDELKETLDGIMSIPDVIEVHVGIECEDNYGSREHAIEISYRRPATVADIEKFTAEQRRKQAEERDFAERQMAAARETLRRLGDRA
jgi:hypothetical protein